MSDSLAANHRGIELQSPLSADLQPILTPAALDFLGRLAREFEPRRQQLLSARQRRQESLDAGVMPDFLPETKSIREGTWQVSPPPADLMRRRVEITGPVDRKMIINALNAGTDVYMADLEDSTSPTWDNTVRGQLNLRDAVGGTISFSNPDGKEYRLAEKTAVLMVRPRGWHLNERHARIDGQPMSGSLFDFGLYFFHNAKALIAKGTGPYFYLPKLESHLEARLWNDVFIFAQKELGVPRGTIKATVLIETILASFEMDEILYELREHSAGLNCGRWDYIFSLIKKLSAHKRFVLSDRQLITMTTSFMRAYSLLTIKTCHRRGIHAMGGMAAQIPIKNDPAANDAALNAVRADKQREAADGHDGTWVAHPGLVPIAMEAFGDIPGGNQLSVMREDVHVTAADLLSVSETPKITLGGIRTNINVGIRYLESWLRGQGCVPINNLMEDAATAEISRAQLWQWSHHKASTVEGQPITPDDIATMIDKELAGIRETMGEPKFIASKFTAAGELFVKMTRADKFPAFLTSLAYESI